LIYRAALNALAGLSQTYVFKKKETACPAVQSYRPPSATAGSVAKNKKHGALLCFSGQILNVRFQMASFSWGDDSELCPVVL
jgi:hypothetical protein